VQPLRDESMILGRIVCLFKGHRRGKFVSTIGGLQIRPGGLNYVGPDGNLLPEQKIYRCPRCGRETRYKVKAAAAQRPAAPTSITVAEANAEYIAKRKV